MNKDFKDKCLIYAAAFLRSIGIGMISVLLAIYLMKIGLTKPQIGMVVGAGLFGAAMGTLFVTFFGDMLGRKKVLMAYAAFSAIGALFVCVSMNFYAILLAAFFGMMNARGKDRGAALVMESSILPSLDTDQNRTKSFVWLYVFQDVGLGLGGLIAGIPTLLSIYMGVPELLAFQLSFGVYAAFMLTSAALYFLLSNKAELSIQDCRTKLSTEGKKMAIKLSSFFLIEGIAGGFLTSALLAFYFYERFGVSLEALGIVFFIAHCLNAASHFVSAWIAKKIGLVNTMVFSHSIANIIFLAIALAPTFPIAVAIYFLRETLAKMEGPTKRSYIMAVVKPEERTKINGITQMIRMLGWAVAPTFAGLVMQEVSLASPLLIGGGLKLTYDMLLYASFRNKKPPEELESAPIANTRPMLAVS